ILNTKAILVNFTLPNLSDIFPATTINTPVTNEVRLTEIFTISGLASKVVCILGPIFKNAWANNQYVNIDKTMPVNNLLPDTFSMFTVIKTSPISMLITIYLFMYFTNLKIAISDNTIYKNTYNYYITIVLLKRGILTTDYY